MIPRPADDLSAVTALAEQDPAALIRQDEAAYAAQITTVAGQIAALRRRLVLLAGPSASGKTTTAHRLCRELGKRGIPAAVISLDNFFKNPADMPIGPDGAPDFESVHSLRLPRLTACLHELMTNGACEMPVFDFERHRVADETRVFTRGEEDVTVVEGLHALHPLIADPLSPNGILRLRTAVGRPLTADGKILLDPRRIRLCRRLIRDARFRNSDPANTLRLWVRVVRGEELYLAPHAAAAQAVIDTLHPGEPCLLRDPLLALARKLDPADPHAGELTALAAAVGRFPALPARLLPADSLLREFLG